MNHAIDNLDLRPYEVIEAAKHAEALDRMWDWPAFPERTARFIAGEPFPMWSGRVLFRFEVSAAEFTSEMRRMREALAYFDRSDYAVHGVVDSEGSLPWQ